MSQSKGSRRSREEISAILARFDESGLTQLAFSKECGVKLSTLRSWLYRRRDEQSPFVAVDLRPPPPALAEVNESRLQIDLGGERRVLIPDDFDAPALAALLPIIVSVC